MENEKQFVEGMFVSKHPNSPDFVKANLSIKVEQFIEYLKSKANAKGYVNINLKESKAGKLYAELDTWQPKEQSEHQTNLYGQEPIENLGEEEINVDELF